MSRGRKKRKGGPGPRRGSRTAAPGRGFPGPAAWAAIGAGAAMLVAVVGFDPFLFTGGDNATYYALAEALATGRGYVDLTHPAAPAHTLYPPGFPALLAPFHLVSGGSLVFMKTASLLAGAALLWGLWRVGRDDAAVPPWAAAAAVGLVGLYPAFQAYTHWVLSDMTYTAVAVLALLALQRSEDAPGRAGWGRWLAACALAVAAFHVRTAGVAVLAAAVGAPLLHRRWGRAAAAAAVSVAGALPWILWSRQPAGSTPGGYVGQAVAASPAAQAGRSWLGFLVERSQEVLVEYGTYQLPGLFWPDPTPPGPVRAIAAALGGGLLLWGAWRAVRTRGVRPWDLYALLTLAILVPWPWLGERILLTVAPFLWLYVLIGADDLSRRATGGRRPAVALAAVVAAALLVGAVAGATRQVPRTRAWLAGDRLAGYSPFWRDYFDAARWIGPNAPDAVVLARKPSLAWYWSGRPSVVYPAGADPERMWRFIRETGVTHFLFEPSTEAALAPTLAPRQDRLELVYRPPGGRAAVVRLARPEGP